MTLQRPSPWLDHPNNRQPQPSKRASFVEYLRWMRIQQESPNGRSFTDTENNGTILQIFDEFAENNFSNALRRLTERTKRLAHNWFAVTCDWRIRVGGTRGPESMLLPAFDALGMPFIPSSTLKGVARAVAMRQANRSQDDSVTLKQVRTIFGDISEPNPCTGQIIFLDAYPSPDDDQQGGLMPDMANALWTWNNDGMPEYKANPNSFLSLEEPTFLIGLRSRPGVPEETLMLVKRWLLTGLAQGIGARVNSGYGALEQVEEDLSIGTVKKKKVLLKVGFELRGQLIHGSQEFSGWQENRRGDNWKSPGNPRPEVRPPAFRSMLRYWFRVLALGRLEKSQVRRLEQEIFGGIDLSPPSTGLFRLEIAGGEISQDNASARDEEYGVAKGTLILRNSSQTSRLDGQKRESLKPMLEALTWLMFHLGGIGLGARRPYYSRQEREYAPWWRGTSLIARSDQKAWKRLSSPEGLQRRFQRRLDRFYQSLESFSGETLSLKTVSVQSGWVEVIDRQCVIVCVEGPKRNEKPFALSVLHREAWRNGQYDADLCGSTNRSSPIWIAKVGRYEVVTAFGSTATKRKNYLDKLKPENNRDAIAYLPVWPME